MTDIQAVTDNSVEIVPIIDRSGSMDSIKSDAIGGFNAFIDEQKALDGKATVSIVLFDHEYTLLQDRVDLSDCIALDNNNFIPRGSTALFDAIGKTIARLKEQKASGLITGGVIVAILTDGGENASWEYTAEQIKKLISECESEFGWTFVFLAANQDAFAVGSSFGISGANAVNFAADAKGVRSAMSTMSAYATTYRSTRAAQVTPQEPDSTE